MYLFFPYSNKYLRNQVRQYCNNIYNSFHFFFFSIRYMHLLHTCRISKVTWSLHKALDEITVSSLYEWGVWLRGLSKSAVIICSEIKSELRALGLSTGHGIVTKLRIFRPVAIKGILCNKHTHIENKHFPKETTNLSDPKKNRIGHIFLLSLLEWRN